MATEFEEVFADELKDALIGKMSEGLSSDGDPTSSWTTNYTISAYKELTRAPHNMELAQRSKIESRYDIYCPVISSSGSTLNINRTMEIVFGSSYSSSLTRYKIEDYDSLVDDHVEIEATIISDD